MAAGTAPGRQGRASTQQVLAQFPALQLLMPAARPASSQLHQSAGQPSAVQPCPAGLERLAATGRLQAARQASGVAGAQGGASCPPALQAWHPPAAAHRRRRRPGGTRHRRPGPCSGGSSPRRRPSGRQPPALPRTPAACRRAGRSPARARLPSAQDSSENLLEQVLCSSQPESGCLPAWCSVHCQAGLWTQPLHPAGSTERSGPVSGRPVPGQQGP